MNMSNARARLLNMQRRYQVTKFVLKSSTVHHKNFTWINKAGLAKQCKLINFKQLVQSFDSISRIDFD